MPPPPPPHRSRRYDAYSMKTCRPAGGIVAAAENLGEHLTGEAIENSPYDVRWGACGPIAASAALTAAARHHTAAGFPRRLFPPSPPRRSSCV